jgi:hypothetical protein
MADGRKHHRNERGTKNASLSVIGGRRTTARQSACVRTIHETTSPNVEKRATRISPLRTKLVINIVGLHAYLFFPYGYCSTYSFPIIQRVTTRVVYV